MHQHAADYKIVHVTLIWNWRLAHSPRHLRRNVPAGSGRLAMVRRVRRVHRRDVFIALNRRRCTGKTAEDAAALGRTANELEQENHARERGYRVDVLPYGVAVAGLSCLLLAAACALGGLAAHRAVALAACRCTCTMSTAISAGVTPAMRAAWPIVRG